MQAQSLPAPATNRNTPACSAQGPARSEVLSRKPHRVGVEQPSIVGRTLFRVLHRPALPKQGRPAQHQESLRLNDLPLAVALMQKAFSELALGAREAEPPMVGGSRGRPDRTEDVNETAAIDNDSPVFEG